MEKPILSHNCALLEAQYDIEISGWMLIYVSRDYITRFKIKGDYITKKQKAGVLKRIELFDSQYEVNQKIPEFRFKFKDLMWMVETKVCKTKVYFDQFFGLSGCPLSTVCFDPKKLMKTVKTEYSDYIALKEIK